MVLSLAFVLGLAAQDPVFQEIRFHRVHLLNGNFVDGTLVRQTKDELVLRIKGGEVGIRNDLVGRVEFVRIRGIKEKPAEITPAPKPAPPPADAPDPFAAVAPSTPLLDAIPAPRVSAQPLDPDQLFAAKGEHREKIDPLLEELKKADIEQKAAVVPRLVEAGAAMAPYLASLLERLDDDGLPHVARALSQLKAPGAVPVLVRLLESGKPAVRARAAAILGATGDASAAPRVLPLMKDEDVDVRKAALASLRALGEAALLPHLPFICADADREVRRAAIAAFVDLSRKLGQDKNVLPGLAGALERSEESGFVDLIEAIAGLRRNESVPILAPYLLVDRVDARLAAVAALATLGGEEAGRAVVARLALEQEKSVRLGLVRAAQQMKLFAAAGPLIGWIGNADQEIHGAALRALAEITGQTFGPDRAAWLAWWKLAKPPE